MKRLIFAFALTTLLFSPTVFAEEKTADKEVDVEVKDLPKAVVDGVKAAQPGCTITAAEKQTKKDGTIVYEVDVTNGGKKFELDVDPTGKVLANVEEKPDAKDEKKEETKK
ncbi:MAG TPA: hypothetical protein VKX17_01130 [Planctomycetota bacterium]|nr:hypothetical protein [Planctomycetota bacterium]